MSESVLGTQADAVRSKSKSHPFGEGYARHLRKHCDSIDPIEIETNDTETCPVAWRRNSIEKDLLKPALSFRTLLRHGHRAQPTSSTPLYESASPGAESGEPKHLRAAGRCVHRVARELRDEPSSCWLGGKDVFSRGPGARGLR